MTLASTETAAANAALAEPLPAARRSHPRCGRLGVASVGRLGNRRRTVAVAARRLDGAGGGRRLAVRRQQRIRLWRGLARAGLWHIGFWDVWIWRRPGGL